MPLKHKAGKKVEAKDAIALGRQRWIHHVNTLAWLEAIPKLEAHAAWFPREVALVICAGPSFTEVPRAMWERVIEAGWFTVGVNHVPRLLQQEHDLYELPALCLWADPAEPQWQGFDEVNFALKDCNGRVLVDENAWKLHHDWLCVAFAKTPSWDLREGLTLTVDGIRLDWPRTSVMAVHLCGCLGFRKIVLLGADHGEDYRPGEVKKANEGYKVIAEFLAQRDIKLINCGARSAVKSIPTVPLDRLLAEGGD